jgi:hypothetical protein
VIRSLTRVSILTMAIVVLGACSTPAADTGTPPPPVGGSTLTAPSAPAATTTAASAAATTEPVSSELAGGSPAAPPDVDPCTLLTADEASTAMGKTLSAGVSAQVDQDRECTFKSGLTELKVILAPPAPDAATAQAYWDTERAKAPAEIKIADLTEFDRSAYGTGSAAGQSISALFVIQGTWFFDLYCGLPACSVAASLVAAHHIVDRLPG